MLQRGPTDAPPCCAAAVLSAATNSAALCLQAYVSPTMARFPAARRRASLFHGLLQLAWECSKPPSTPVGVHHHHTVRAYFKVPRFLQICRNLLLGTAIITRKTVGVGTIRLETPRQRVKHSIRPVVGSPRTMRALSRKVDYQTCAIMSLQTSVTDCRFIGCLQRRPSPASYEDLVEGSESAARVINTYSVFHADWPYDGAVCRATL